MYRENIMQFMQDGEKVMFTPSNGGLKYVDSVLIKAGIPQPKLEAMLYQEQKLRFERARGEDIVQRVSDRSEQDQLTPGSPTPSGHLLTNVPR